MTENSWKSSLIVNFPHTKLTKAGKIQQIKRKLNEMQPTKTKN